MARTPRGRGKGKSSKVYSELESAVAPPGVPRSLSTATNSTRTAQSPANKRRSSRAKLSPHTHGVAIASILASPGEWFQTVDGLQENNNFSRAETVLNKVAREKRLSLAEDNRNVRLYPHPFGQQKKRGRRKAGVNPGGSKEKKGFEPAPEDVDEDVDGDSEAPHNKRARRKAAVNAVENIKKDAQTSPERDDDSDDLLPYNPRRISGGSLADGKGARSAQSSPPPKIESFVPRGKAEERWLRNFNKWKSVVSEQRESTHSPLPKNWVQDQRSQYRQLQQNNKSQLTRDRIALLEAAGFKWGVRKKKSQPINESAVPSDEKESNVVGIGGTGDRSDITSKTSEMRRSPRKGKPTQFFHNTEAASADSAKPKTTGISNTSRPQNAQSELRTLSDLLSNTFKSKSAASRKRKRGGRHSMSSLSMTASDEGTKLESNPLSKRELDEQLIKMEKIRKRRSEGAAKRKQKQKEPLPKETLPQTEPKEIGAVIAESRQEKPSPPPSPLVPSELLAAYGGDRLSKPNDTAPEVKDTALDNFKSPRDAEEPEQVPETNVTKLLVSCLSEDSAERLTAELMKENPPSPIDEDKGVPKSSDQLPAFKYSTSNSDDNGDNLVNATHVEKNSSLELDSETRPSTIFRSSSPGAKELGPRRSPPSKSRRSPSPSKRRGLSSTGGALASLSASQRAGPHVPSDEKATRRQEVTDANSTRDLAVEVAVARCSNTSAQDHAKLSTDQRKDEDASTESNETENSETEGSKVDPDQSEMQVKFPSHDQEIGHFASDSNVSNEETAIPKQVTRWTCDVCKVAAFDTYEEAEAHEKTCSFGKELGKETEPPLDMGKKSSTETDASSQPPEGMSQEESDVTSVEKPASDEAPRQKAAELTDQTPNDTAEANKIVRALQPVNHSPERLEDSTDRAEALQGLALCPDNETAGVSMVRQHPRNDAQLEMAAASELYDEKMAEARRLELASKMVSQRMREIELEMRHIDSDGGPARQYSDDGLPRRRHRHHHVEEFETITHRRSYRSATAASPSIHEGWPRRRYESESDGQYSDGPYYSPGRRRRRHMSEDLGPRYYPGHEPSRRRQDSYDRYGGRRAEPGDPREDDFSDDYGARGGRGGGSPRTRGRRSGREHRDDQREARRHQSSRDRADSPDMRRGGRRRHRPRDEGYYSEDEDGPAVARTPTRRSGKRPRAERDLDGDSPGRRSPEKRRKRSTPPPSSSGKKKKRKGRTPPSSGRGKRLSPLKRGKMSSLELTGLDNGLVLSEVADGEPDGGSGGSDAGGSEGGRGGKPEDPAVAGVGGEGLADDSDEDTWSDGTLLLPPPPA